MEEVKDSGTTGNFEIFVNDKLVWSKKTRHQGFFDTAPSKAQEVVFAAINAAGASPSMRLDKKAETSVTIQFCGS